MYPHERSLVKRMTNRPFALIGVNSDKRERVEKAVQENGISWPSFFDGGSTGGPIAKTWGVRGWPTIYVLDADGKIRYKNVRGAAMDAAVDELVKETIEGIAEQLREGEPADRGRAAFLLGKYQAADAIEQLKSLLDDEAELVRVRTAVGLVRLGEPVEPLLELVRQAVRDEDPEVRVAALRILADADDQASAALVLSALEDGNSEVQYAAMAAIGQLKLEDGLPAVAQRARDPDPQTARRAIAALGEFRTPGSVALLREIASDAAFPARIWIAVALHQSGDDATQRRFEAFLQERDETARKAAMRALIDLKDFDATDLYIKALDDSDRDVFRMARDALRDNPEPRAVEALKKSLSREVENLWGQLAGRDFAARRRAQTELLELGPAVAPLLLERMEQATAQSQLELSTIIGRLNDTGVIPTVAERLADPSLGQSTRTGYENILRAMRDDSSEAAMALARHDQPSVRESGVRVLASCRGNAALDMLRSALKDASDGVRLQAACGLAQRRDDEALPELRAAARSKRREHRRLAVSGLGRYGADETLAVLLELVDDPDRDVRSQLLKAMGNYKDAAATQAIQQITGQDESLQYAAVYALQRQDTPEAARVLGDFLQSGNSAVQQRARSALQRMRTPEARQKLQ